MLLAFGVSCTSTDESDSSERTTQAALLAKIEQLKEDLSTVEVTVFLPNEIDGIDGSASLTLAELGVTLDINSTTEAIRAIREQSLTDNTVSATGTASETQWQPLESDPSDDQLRFSLAPDTAESSLNGTELLRTRSKPSEVIVQNGALAARINTEFVFVDYDGLLATVLQAVTTDSSTALTNGIEVTAPVLDHRVSSNPDLYQVTIDTANAKYGRPPELTYNGRTLQLPLETVATWLELADSETGPTISVNTQLIQPAAEELFGTTADTELAEAVFEITANNQVKIVAENGAVLCCASGSAAEIMAALDDANHGEPLRLASRPAVSAEQLEHMRSLQIVEQVSEFTTHHGCCQNRVTNIQKMADLMKGAVIEPGDSLSINERVGKRTREKGFLPGGFIQHGVLAQDIGGGVSQFATTMFNAAFFAGLEIDEYQMHSIYFSRYPYGREATLSFPKPDLVLRNQTPYSVLVWSSYTDTSITVKLYSTKHIDVTAGRPVVTKRDQCARVRTTRTRTYSDATIEPEEDSFFATYRPEEGYDCDGTPSDPEAVLCPDPIAEGETDRTGEETSEEGEVEEVEASIAPPTQGGGGETSTTVCVPRYVGTTTTTTDTDNSTDTSSNTTTGATDPESTTSTSEATHQIIDEDTGEVLLETNEPE